MQRQKLALPPVSLMLDIKSLSWLLIKRPWCGGKAQLWQICLVSAQAPTILRVMPRPSHPLGAWCFSGTVLGARAGQIRRSQAWLIQGCSDEKAQDRVPVTGAVISVSKSILGTER